MSAAQPNANPSSLSVEPSELTAASKQHDITDWDE
jgi:hypothetical protein